METLEYLYSTICQLFVQTHIPKIQMILHMVTVTLSQCLHPVNEEFFLKNYCLDTWDALNIIFFVPHQTYATFLVVAW